MKLKPLRGKIIVKLLSAEEKTKGGIIVPDTAKEKPQEGEVVAVGNVKRPKKGKAVSPEVKAGDRILFAKYSGNEIKVKGEDSLIVEQDEILAIIK